MQQGGVRLGRRSGDGRPDPNISLHTTLGCTTCACVCAPCMQAAIAMLQPTGGKLHCFLSTLPTLGVHSLKLTDGVGAGEKDELMVPTPQVSAMSGWVWVSLWGRGGRRGWGACCEIKRPLAAYYLLTGITKHCFCILCCLRLCPWLCCLAVPAFDCL